MKTRERSWSARNELRTLSRKTLPFVTYDQQICPFSALQAKITFPQNEISVGLLNLNWWLGPDAIIRLHQPLGHWPYQLPFIHCRVRGSIKTPAGQFFGLQGEPAQCGQVSTNHHHHVLVINFTANSSCESCHLGGTPIIHPLHPTTDDNLR